MMLAAVEGIDGSGKTTLVTALAAALAARRIAVVTHREPSGGPIGRLFRQLSAEGEHDPPALALLSAADRLDQQAMLTRPAAGLVLSDRYYLSGLAYHAADGVDPVFYQGSAMPRRVCPDSDLCDCRPCDVLEGEGGAGSFSDGKITLSATRGTHGASLTSGQERYLDVVEVTIRRFTPTLADYPPADGLPPLPAGHGGLGFESYPLIHAGSDGIRAFGQPYSAHLRQAGVDIRLGQQVTALLCDGVRASGAPRLAGWPTLWTPCSAGSRPRTGRAPTARHMPSGPRTGCGSSSPTRAMSCARR